MRFVNDRLDSPAGREGHEPALSERHLDALLHRLYRATPSPGLDATMAASLRSGASARSRVAAQRVLRLPLPAGRRLASLGAALALLLGGSLGYLHLSGPTPVSAQTVLSRAAAAMRLLPGEAAHLSYTVSITPPAAQAGSVAGAKGTMISKADVWVQAAANGASTVSAQTLTAAEEASPQAQAAKGRAVQGVGPLLGRYLQIGQQTYGYVGGSNAIVIPGSHDQHPGWMIPNAALDGAGVAQELSALAQRSPQQVQVLPEQALDGIDVDVLQVNGWADAPAMRTTLYFDSQSFLLRGYDAVSIDPSYPTASWQVRLNSYAMLAVSAVPSHAFTLNAPADARIDEPRLDLDRFVSTFQSACQSTLTVAQLVHILQAKQQTLLAACQTTAPARSADDLVGALIAPYNVTLAAAAAAIQITPEQVSAALVAQQQWLAILVGTPGGGSSFD